MIFFAKNVFVNLGIPSINLGLECLEGLIYIKIVVLHSVERWFQASTFGSFEIRI